MEKFKYNSLTPLYMKYPTELVHKYGAKAGILMYVKENLPDIPQADMIVKTPNESVESVLERADKNNILWPRLFRSSAVEELYGYEGVFPTLIFSEYEYGRAIDLVRNIRMEFDSKESFYSYLKNKIIDIQKFSKQLRWNYPEIEEYKKLSDNICVIIAEKSPSSITGTYIKHPNQKEFYIISATLADSINSNNPKHSAYIYRQGEGISRFKFFDKGEIEESNDLSDNAQNMIFSELETVVSWHDRISNLHEMDKNLTYQIEFGLDPVCLYQVRPFKPIEYADFSLEKMELYTEYFVIGITPKEGLNFIVQKNIKEKCYQDKINPGHIKEKSNPEKNPTVLYGNIREAMYCDRIENHQANLLNYAKGFFAHEDIRAIKKAKVSGLFSTYVNCYYEINQGDWINIVSDGKTLNIHKIK
jgi:hypothetical protein